MTLPLELRWEDDDPPPVGINAARLRAKYWGARYVIHRPFLHNVLHPPKSAREATVQSTPSARSESDARSPPTPSQPDRPPSQAMPPPRSVSSNHRSPPDVIDESILEACRNCIHAAFKSTQAFHGIPENHRPIVTNIFGTAHA